MMIIRNYIVKILTPGGVLNAQTDVNEVKISGKPILTDKRDSKGRSKQVGVDAKFEFSVMNNRNTDIKAFMLFLEQNDLVQVTFEDEENADAGAINMKNVRIITEDEASGDGKHTSLKCWFDKIVSRAIWRQIRLDDANAAITTAVTGGGVGNSAAGAGNYRLGATVTLVATPGVDSLFVNWTIAGVVVSTTATYSFPCVEAVTVTAHFTGV